MQPVKTISVAITSFIFLFLQVAFAYESNTYIVRKKLADPSINYQKELNQGSNQIYHLPKTRNITLSDSGRTSSLMFLQNINFHYLGDVGFYTPSLSLSLLPNDSSSPVIFDDPTSFSLVIHQGTIILSPVALNALFNEQIFNFKGATVRNLHASTAPGMMTLTGEMYRDKWIPFTMKGNITLKEGHLLYFNPTTVLVNGIDTTKVLAAANVQLDQLLKIKATGAELIGSTIVLDALKVFPPPKLTLKITSVKLEEQGLVLQVNDGFNLLPKPLRPSFSHIIIRGGDVKFMRTIALNVAMQIDSNEPGKTLQFCLYRYRDQLARGNLTLSRRGEIQVYFAAPHCSLSGVNS